MPSKKYRLRMGLGHFALVFRISMLRGPTTGDFRLAPKNWHLTRLGPTVLRSCGGCKTRRTSPQLYQLHKHYSRFYLLRWWRITQGFLNKSPLQHSSRTGTSDSELVRPQLHPG